MLGNVGEPGIRRDWLGGFAPGFPPMVFRAPDSGIPAGDIGVPDQGIWPAAPASVVVRGGCPCTRFGGNPVLGAECMFGAPAIPPIKGDCCGACDQAGAGAGACTAAGA